MSLQGKHVVIVGGASGMARQLAEDAVAEGAAVTWAGRTPERLVLPGVRAAYADLGDEQSLKALAEDVGELDHLVSLAADPANGPLATLDRAAVELAPIRVNALSPGIVDSGAWDRLGEAKEGLFRRTAESNPARRVGTTANISAAARQALTNPFVTGTILHVDGGARLG